MAKNKQLERRDGVYIVYHKEVQMKMFAKRYDGRWYYFGPGYADMGAYGGEDGYPCDGEDDLVEILAGPLETYTITPDSCGGDSETIDHTIRACNAYDRDQRAIKELREALLAVRVIVGQEVEAALDNTKQTVQP